MDQIPSNIIPWLIGGAVFCLFGVRALVNYRRLHNPLSKYFASIGFCLAIAFWSWSVPFFFTNNLTYLTVANIFGDFFLYSMFVVQSYVLYYLALKNRVSPYVVVLPTAILAGIGWLANSYGYVHNGVAITGGKFVYTLPLLADIAQAVLLGIVLLVGILLLSKVRQQTSTRAKAGLIGIAALYILPSIAGLLNVVLSGDTNQSPLVLASYAVGFLVFVVVLVLVRVFGRKPKSTAQAKRR